VASLNACRVGERVDRADETERRLRHLVAEQLGIDVAELRPVCSLLDDLAADSLDLAELTLVLEAEFGVTLSQRAIEELRTYGDLVHLVQRAPSSPRDQRAALPPVGARVRLTMPAGCVNLERTGALTPYLIEVLVEDALRAGPGARLDVELPADSDAACLAAAEDGFVRLARRGIAVTVRRQRRAAA
jgi:acyl carrier protein